MTLSSPLRKISITSFSAILILALVLAAVSVSMIAARRDPDTLATAWQNHRQACLKSPEEIYHRDRARAVRGIVHASEGKPVPGARVQCVRLTSLLELARRNTTTADLWSGLVETETITDSQGRYEFPHLSEGCRTICASASGFASDVQNMVLTQDGSGATVDFNLDAPKTLRVQLRHTGNHRLRIQLVPNRWWPELLSRDIGAGTTEVEFSGIGGPFKKGLIVVSDLSSPSSEWKPKAAYNLDRSGDVTVSFITNYIPSSHDVPEAECVHAVHPWPDGTSEAKRLFFSMLTPVALFWQTDQPVQSSASADFSGQGLALRPENRDLRMYVPNSFGGLLSPRALFWPTDLLSQTSASGDSANQAPRVRKATSGLHGYGPNPFLPVLIESRDGRAWLEWTSGASEFELVNVPAGLYRVRSFDTFGKMSFARGLVASPSEVADLKSGLGDRIQLDEPRSREVMGFVRWENGSPAQNAEVFLQDAANFRRFLERVVTNENGFFSISNVPAAQYVSFALPPNDENSMKNFIYPYVKETPREVWLDFTLSPHRIVGQRPEVGSSKRLELLREDPEVQACLFWPVTSGMIPWAVPISLKGQERVVWAVTPTEGGQFKISNVPHGRYKVRTASEGSAAAITSLPFVIERDLVTTVRWP